MNECIKTIGTLLSERESNTFWGRNKEIKQFKQLINSTLLKKPILNIFGIGGIGKTWLVKEYLRISNESHIPVAMVDLRIQRGDFLSFIQEFRCQLGKKVVYESNVFSEFDSKIKKLREIERKLDKLHKKNNSVLENATTDGMVTTISSTIGAIIGSFGGIGGTIVGSGFGAAGGKVLMSNALVEKALVSLTRKGLNINDAKFIVNLNTVLTDSYVSSVNSIAEQSGKVILVFDTYEEISPVLDDWVREFFLPKFQNNILFIISGRDTLIKHNTNWHSFSNIVNVIELDRFSKLEAKKYLLSRNISDLQHVNKIIDFTECLPWALALVFDMQIEGLKLTCSNFEESSFKHVVGHRVVKRFLRQYAETGFTNLMDICTVSRSFDYDLLTKLSNSNTVKEFFDKVRYYSFVRILNDGSFSLHDIVRSFMLKELKATNYNRFFELNSSLYEYHKANIKKTQPNELRKRHTIECIYHCLHADENIGIKEFKELFSTLDVFRQFDFRDALLSEVIRFDFKNDDNKNWQSFCKSFQSVNKGEWETAKKGLEKICTIENLDPLLKCLVFDTLGDLLTGQGMYKSAVTLFENSKNIKQKIKGIDLVIGYGQTLSRLCEGYAILGKCKKAENSAKNNLEICVSKNDKLGEAWVYKSFGDIYRLWGKTTLAIENLKKSLSIFRENNDEFGTGFVLTQLGRVYTHSGEWSLGEKCLSDSKKIFEKLCVEYGKANSMLFLGNIERFRQNWSKAQNLYSKALEMHEKMNSKREIGPLLGSLGLFYLNKKDFSKSKQFLEKSLEMKRSQDYIRGISVSMIHIGQFYKIKKMYTESLTHFSGALRFANKSSSNYHRVEAMIETLDILRLCRKYEEMEEYTKKAFSLAKYYKYPHLLAKLNLIIGHTNAAQSKQSEAYLSYIETIKCAVNYNHEFTEQILNKIYTYLKDNIVNGNQTVIKVIKKLISPQNSFFSKLNKNGNIIDCENDNNLVLSLKNFLDKCGTLLNVEAESF